MNIPLVVLLIYAGLLMGVGLIVGRRVQTSSDFFVAGRRLGPGLIFTTLLAANIGAGSTMGAAKLGYSDGLSAWWWVGSAGLGSLVLAFWVGPTLRGIAARHDLSTVGDYLEHRYGPQVRGMISVLLWAGGLSLLAGQLVAMGVVVEAVTGIDPRVGSIVGGLVVTVYFTAGGLLASVWVNAVQLAVLMVGLLGTFPVILGSVGGLASLREATRHIDDFWNFWQAGDSGWFYLASIGPSFIVSPGILQRVYAARDDRAVRIGVGLNAVALLVFAAAPPLLGMMARVVAPELENPDQALPILLLETLPVLLSAGALAAIFSAEVSSADAMLFWLSTSLAKDLYARFVRPEATDAQILSVARWAAVAGGGAGIAIAILSTSIVAALTIFYDLLAVSLFVPLIVGLYTRHIRTREALASIVAGVGALSLVRLTAGAAGMLGLTPAMWGLGAAGAAAAYVVATRSVAASNTKERSARD
ncbi:MAG: sodium:solute symporter family protein [Acidobacteria bacterium]|nr:sodium:solute symporter family protein [Acidobacteriota bacterium]